MRVRRDGFALVWMLLALVLAAALLAILWSQGAESRARARRMQLAARARLLASGGLAHALHKVEKTIAYFDERLEGGFALDVGATDPGYMEDLSGEVDYNLGTGSYRVVSLVVRRQRTTSGEGVLKVSVAAEAAVEARDERRRERMDGDFRLFGRAGGG